MSAVPDNSPTYEQRSGTSAHNFSVRMVVWLACSAFAPMLAVALLAKPYAAKLASIIPARDAFNNFGDLTAFISFVLGRNPYFANAEDSWGPMQKALNLLHSPQKDALFERLFFDQKVRFQYPPTSLLPIELLGKLGVTSFAALNSINAGLFFVLIAAVALLAFKAFAPSASFSTRLALACIAALATALYYPALRALNLGQIQIWIDVLFALGCLSWLGGKRTAAGVLMGLACVIKPNFAVLLLWGLLWREWRFSLGMICAAAPIALISLVHYGWHNHIAYLSVLSFLSNHGESFFANNSVNGILNRAFGIGTNLDWQFGEFTPVNPLVHTATMITGAAAVALALAPALFARRRAGIADLMFAALLVVIGAPIAWEHHYGILLPIYVIMLRDIAMSDLPGRSLKLAALGTSWFLTATFNPFANLLAGSPLNFLQSYLFFGALILLGLLSTQVIGTSRHNTSLARSA